MRKTILFSFLVLALIFQVFAEGDQQEKTDHGGYEHGGENGEHGQHGEHGEHGENGEHGEHGGHGGHGHGHGHDDDDDNDHHHRPQPQPQPDPANITCSVCVNLMNNAKQLGEQGAESFINILHSTCNQFPQGVLECHDLARRFAVEMQTFVNSKSLITSQQFCVSLNACPQPSCPRGQHKCSSGACVRSYDDCHDDGNHMKELILLGLGIVTFIAAFALLVLLLVLVRRFCKRDCRHVPLQEVASEKSASSGVFPSMHVVASYLQPGATAYVPLYDAEAAAKFEQHEKTPSA